MAESKHDQIAEGLVRKFETKYKRKRKGDNPYFTSILPDKEV